MSNRTRGLSKGLLIAVLLAFSVSCFETEKINEKPNFIIIFIDELSY